MLLRSYVRCSSKLRIHHYVLLHFSTHPRCLFIEGFFLYVIHYRRSRSPKDKHSYSVSSKEESDRHRKHLPQKGRLSESFVKSSFQHSDKAKHADGAKQSAEEVEGMPVQL